jgi:hypothetical protein
MRVCLLEESISGFISPTMLEGEEEAIFIHQLTINRKKARDDYHKYTGMPPSRSIPVILTFGS